MLREGRKAGGGAKRLGRRLLTLGLAFLGVGMLSVSEIRADEGSLPIFPTTTNTETVDEKLAAAEQKLQLGRTDEALADFEALLSEFSDGSWRNRSVRDRIERLLTERGKETALTDYYENRLKNHPDDLETTRRLANAFLKQGRIGDAITTLTAALKKAPSDLALRLTLIDALKRRSAFDELDAQYVEMQKFDPENPEPFVQQGLATLENPRLDETTRRSHAAEIWRKMLVRHENDPQRALLLADLFARNGFSSDAEKEYRRGIALTSNDEKNRETLELAYHRLAALQSETGRLGEALETVRKLEKIAQTPENSRSLAELLAAAGHQSEQIETLASAAEHFPDDSPLSAALFQALTEAGRLDEAWELGIQRLERAADFSEKRGVITALAEWSKRNGRLPQLIEQLRQTHDVAENKREAAFLLAQAFSTVQNDNAARETLEALLGDSTTNDSTTTNNATNGDASNNEEQLPNTLSEDAALLEQLSLIAENQGDFAAAIRYQERLCAASSDVSKRDPSKHDASNHDAKKEYARTNRRLGTLYLAAHERQKWTEWFLRTMLDELDFAGQLQAVDEALGRDDYFAAEKMLDRIESGPQHHLGQSWETLFRRTELALFTGEMEEASELFDRLAALASEGGTPAPSDNSAKISSKNNVEAAKFWRIVTPNRPALPLAAILPERLFGTPEETSNEAALFGAWFREHLEPPKSDAEQPRENVPSKPLPIPATYSDALFLARFWKLKMAFDQDQKQVPLQEKNLTQNQPQEKDASGNDSVAAQGSRFDEALCAFRTDWPLDIESGAASMAESRRTLYERLRLEEFLIALSRCALLGASPFTDESRRTEAETFAATAIVRLAALGEREALERVVRLLLDELRRPKGNAALVPMPNLEEKLALATRCFETLDVTAARKNGLLSEVPLLRRALETSGFTEEVKRLDAAVDRLCRNAPTLRLSLLLGELRGANDAERTVEIARRQTELMFRDAKRVTLDADTPALFEKTFVTALTQITTPLDDFLGPDPNAPVGISLQKRTDFGSKKRGPAEPKIALTAEELSRIDRAERSVYALLDLYYQAREQFSNPDFFSRSETSAPKTSLADFERFLLAQEGTRGYFIAALLQKAGYRSAHYAGVSPDVQRSAADFFRRIDEALAKTPAETPNAATQRSERFRAFLAKRKNEGSEGVRDATTQFEELAAVDLGEGSQAEVEVSPLIEKLEAKRNAARESRQPLDNRQTLLTASLYSATGKTDAVIRLLDELNLWSPGEIRLRERIILELFRQNPTHRERAAEAARRFAGYRLNEAEQILLRDVLRLLGQNIAPAKNPDRKTTDTHR